MKLISAKNSITRSAKSASPYSALDSAEMELTLQELGDAPSSRHTHLMLSPDLLSEYASCASLIMDRQEREAVARELLNTQRHSPMAA